MADTLAIRVVPEGARTLLALSGELDTFGSETLAPWLTGDVILEMSDVTFIDSNGIRTIARALRTCQLVIRNPSNAVNRVLEIVGLLDLLEP